MIENYYDDFVAGMTALKEKYPVDPDDTSMFSGGHHPIDAFNVVVMLADEEIWPLFIGLAGPEAPDYADELSELIRGFISARKQDQLFSGCDSRGLAQFIPSTWADNTAGAPQPEIPECYRRN
ncbi:hypothetical protein [Rhodococcus sp. 27YEA6]|uniref:hypothetical protein n=1 Tax=Rhodococcus sp. 27YEA6 TaxID=3156273 RepID=UPI0038392815